MKLLIVDDEKITREGILSSIHWESLGIFETFEAEDGLNALAVARREMPDIILCDIRMPRMNGIQFVEQVRETLPETSVIFMSGYSDKEYLKAAIKLKAVNYVEKPLNPVEIEEAILAAKAEHLDRVRNLQNESLDAMQKSMKLATLLTKPYLDNKEQIKQLGETLSIRTDNRLITYIVQISDNIRETTDVSPFAMDFKLYLESLNLTLLYVVLHHNYHVFFILGSTAHSPLSQKEIETTLLSRFRHTTYFYIGKGAKSTGIPKAFSSYTSAVVALQSSFFFPPATILSAPDSTTHGEAPYEEADLNSYKHFEEMLLERREKEVNALVEQLYQFYHKNRFALPSQAKGLYFRLLMTLYDAASSLSIYSFLEYTHIPQGEKQIMEALDACFSYDDLHHLFALGITEYFDAYKNADNKSSTINLIKDYISKHYMREALTIKEISDYAHLSLSYMCTYFKNQTGLTLNQYITEYRMKKAMQLLKDPRNQITDISAQVGYNNGNYFSKSFKKYTGMTPSGFRENLLK